MRLTILTWLVVFSNLLRESWEQEYSSSNTTDEECLGNRLEALELGRQCSRRCRRDVPCENTRKHCLCDGPCGLSCIKPDLTCPELATLENGYFSPRINLFKTKVTFKCNEGYYLFGSHERICQGDEEWSGTKAECLREAQCHNPPKINHAKNPSDGIYSLGDRISYSCYPGYQSKGSHEAVCELFEETNQTAWVWTKPENFRTSKSSEQKQYQFKCIPKSCGDPGQIENGKRHGESFIIASSVLYTCNDGFQMVGQARRYCQSDNLWSGQAPHCEPVTCSPTEHLENGKINYNYPLVYNSTVEYSCDYGFRLVGLRRRRCGNEGKLVGEPPTCEEIDCGELGPLHNGYVKGYSSRMGDKRQFVCMEGMTFEGQHHEATCLESGFWSAQLPRCLAPCRVPRIEASASISLIPAGLQLSQANSTGLATERTLEEMEPGSMVPHDSMLAIECKKSFELDDEHVNRSNNDLLVEPPRCDNEKWTYLPECRPAKCNQSPPAPKNGRVRVLSIEHGAIGYVHCLDGFKLKGDSITRCQHGIWTLINSSCIEIYCNYPGQIEHGRVLLVGLTGMYDYKPYIKRMPNNRQIQFECDSGYRMSDGAAGGATCIDGLWKPEGLPSCIKELNVSDQGRTREMP